MPTPFMHLDLAGKLLARLDAVRNVGEYDDLTALLRRQWPAFLLGNVGPDVQTLAKLPRAASHFYTMPPAADWDAAAALPAHYPELARDQCHSTAQAVFLAGYQSHLLVDVHWFRHVLVPFFVEPPGLGSIDERILLHNLTLIVLDQRSRAALPEDIAGTLAAAEPQAWLPFVTDADLRAWRDDLATQLADGKSETVAIYAQRMSLPADDLRNVVNDVQWLQSHLLARVPLTMIESQLETAIDLSLAVVNSYLQAGES